MESDAGMCAAMSAPEDLGLPVAAKERLVGRLNGNLVEALDHPLRRSIVREIQFVNLPLSVTELGRGSCHSLRAADRGSLEHHVALLDHLGVLKRVSELVTAAGFEWTFLSTVAGDQAVEQVLIETADLDRVWVAER